MTDVIKRRPKLQENKVVPRKRLCTISPLYKELKLAWDAPRPNLEKCGKLLESLKVKLVSMNYLPALAERASNQELSVARDILETGVLWAVAIKDLEAFERYVAQLKCYYFDYNRFLTESPLKYEILGLNLLYLLSQNRVAEFHTELELLPPNVLQTNNFIMHPLLLEQCLMEGSYNKIFNAKLTVPSKSYGFFMDVLLETIRGEIAGCLESAYKVLSVKEVAKKLHMSTQKAAIEYGVGVKKWTLRKKEFVFDLNEKAQNRKQEVIPSKSFTENVLGFAKELEMIV